MRKVFISAMPMHLVQSYAYTSSRYPQSSPTAFPITIPLEQQCRGKDELLVLTLVPQEENRRTPAQDNYEAFKAQVEAIAAAHEAKISLVEIVVPADINTGSPRLLYNSLNGILQDGDRIYTDITYGFRYNSIVIFSSLFKLYQKNENVDIEAICYGALKDGKAELFDMSSIFYLTALNNMQ